MATQTKGRVSRTLRRDYDMGKPDTIRNYDFNTYSYINYKGTVYQLDDLVVKKKNYNLYLVNQIDPITQANTLNLCIDLIDENGSHHKTFFDTSFELEGANVNPIPIFDVIDHAPELQNLTFLRQAIAYVVYNFYLKPEGLDSMVKGLEKVFNSETERYEGLYDVHKKELNKKIKELNEYIKDLYENPSKYGELWEKSHGVKAIKRGFAAAARFFQERLFKNPGVIKIYYGTKDPQTKKYPFVYGFTFEEHLGRQKLLGSSFAIVTNDDLKLMINSSVRSGPTLKPKYEEQTKANTYQLVFYDHKIVKMNKENKEGHKLNWWNADGISNVIDRWVNDLQISDESIKQKVVSALTNDYNRFILGSVTHLSTHYDMQDPTKLKISFNELKEGIEVYNNLANNDLLAKFNIKRPGFFKRLAGPSKKRGPAPAPPTLSPNPQNQPPKKKGLLAMFGLGGKTKTAKITPAPPAPAAAGTKKAGFRERMRDIFGFGRNTKKAKAVPGGVPHVHEETPRGSPGQITVPESFSMEEVTSINKGNVSAMIKVVSSIISGLDQPAATDYKSMPPQLKLLFNYILRVNHIKVNDNEKDFANYNRVATLDKGLIKERLLNSLELYIKEHYNQVLSENMVIQYLKEAVNLERNTDDFLNHIFRIYIKKELGSDINKLVWVLNYLNNKENFESQHPYEASTYKSDYETLFAIFDASGNFDNAYDILLNIYNELSQANSPAAVNNTPVNVNTTQYADLAFGNPPGSITKPQVITNTTQYQTMGLGGRLVTESEMRNLNAPLRSPAKQQFNNSTAPPKPENLLQYTKKPGNPLFNDIRKGGSGIRKRLKPAQPVDKPLTPSAEIKMKLNARRKGIDPTTQQTATFPPK